jgi:biotin operon repressor
VATLDIDVQGAKDYEEQERKASEAQAKLAELKPTIADPQGNAIAAMLRSLGVPIEDATAARVISVLASLLIELTGLYGFDAALRRPAIAEKPARPRRQESAQPVAVQVATASPPEQARRARATDPVAATLEGIRDLIDGTRPLVEGLSVARDGSLHYSQQALGRALGLSATEVNKHLKRLAQDKAAFISATAKGSSLKLASGLLNQHKP